MANIKLDKHVIVSFRFTVADESRFQVVLQFSLFFLVTKFGWSRLVWLRRYDILRSQANCE